MRTKMAEVHATKRRVTAACAKSDLLGAVTELTNLASLCGGLRKASWHRGQTLLNQAHREVCRLTCQKAGF